MESLEKLPVDRQGSCLQCIPPQLPLCRTGPWVQQIRDVSERRKKKGTLAKTRSFVAVALNKETLPTEERCRQRRVLGQGFGEVIPICRVVLPRQPRGSRFFNPLVGHASVCVCCVLCCRSLDGHCAWLQRTLSQQTGAPTSLGMLEQCVLQPTAARRLTNGALTCGQSSG